MKEGGQKSIWILSHIDFLKWTFILEHPKKGKVDHQIGTEVL